MGDPGSELFFPTTTDRYLASFKVTLDPVGGKGAAVCSSWTQLVASDLNKQMSLKQRLSFRVHSSVVQYAGTRSTNNIQSGIVKSSYARGCSHNRRLLTWWYGPKYI